MNEVLQSLRTVRDEFESRMPAPGTKVRSILTALSHGGSIKSVAKDFEISTETVKSYVEHARRRLQMPFREARPMIVQSRLVDCKITMCQVHALLEAGKIEEAKKRLEEGVLL